MERELIVERTRAGLAAAREQGRIGGRRRVMTPDVVDRCRQMLANGASRQQVADVIGGEDDLQILSCCRPRSRIPALPVICNI